MSSSELAISVRGLSKSYTIVSNVEKHITMAETLLARAKNPFKRPETETFRALKEVDFDIRTGEVVGFIGRNGAGKSTLLKILSQITEPTSGEVRLYGRVGSLLEVGTGFHPELTGRENIFLNGAILGMTRKEITRQFDDIVAFAEVETFLDTPVKRYSSGMYVRLAFAVAAHLNPEILIVDEVLAVGDAAFQRKCLGKMEDVAKTGRTVLFVSHNMDAVRRLCSRGIILEHGSVMQDGPASETVRTYLDLLRQPSQIGDVAMKNRLNRHSCVVKFTQVSAMDVDGHETWDFETGDTIRFKVSYHCTESVPSLAVYMAFRSCVNKEVITSVTETISERPIEPGETGSFLVEIPNANLRPGSYSLYIAFGNKEYEAFYDVVDENVNLPILCISSEEQDPHRIVGYFSLPSRIVHT